MTDNKFEKLDRLTGYMTEDRTAIKLQKQRYLKQGCDAAAFEITNEHNRKILVVFNTPAVGIRLIRGRTFKFSIPPPSLPPLPVVICAFFRARQNPAKQNVDLIRKKQSRV